MMNSGGEDDCSWGSSWEPQDEQVGVQRYVMVIIHSAVSRHTRRHARPSAANACHVLYANMFLYLTLTITDRSSTFKPNPVITINTNHSFLLLLSLIKKSHLHSERPY